MIPRARAQLARVAEMCVATSFTAPTLVATFGPQRPAADVVAGIIAAAMASTTMTAPKPAHACLTTSRR